MSDFSARLAEIDERHRAARIKRDREFFQLLALHLIVVIIGLSFFFIGKPELDRLAKVNQEMAYGK